MTVKTFVPACILLICATIVYAQHEGHEGWEEESSTPMNIPASVHSSMKPYMHFTLGDHVWFEEWIPRTKGAMAGACLGLFLLGVIERWLAALRAVANIWWRARTTDYLDTIHESHPRRPAIQSKLSSLSEKEKLDGIAELTANPTPPPTPRGYRAFRARFSAPPMSTNEVCRGILYAAQSALTFAFMLVVMTYQAAFLISIVLGLGFGEMLFGRYTNAHVGLLM